MLSPGSQLGSYEVLSPLGAGGMGEVYRARDTKLKREVAIKVLPDAFATDADRVSRLQREAEVLALLNHPNIAAIHELGESKGSRFLVLELVEGDTLDDRIRRGALPVDDSLKIARQIAEALQAAHEKGVMHRDLKPANIKITPGDVVKVLDFGLAKIYESEMQEASSLSPTLLSKTHQNVIIGTASYMSPEQARGHAVDKASDIWAYGCVLYEMLTGKQTFPGETITDVLGGIVKVDPDWSALPGATPAPIRSLLKRCLQKDRRRRMKDISEAIIEIEDIVREAPKPAAIAVIAPAAVVAPKRRGVLGWILAAIFLLIAGAAVPVAVTHFRETEPTPRAIRFVVLSPEKATVFGQPPAISPDGLRLAFVASEGGLQQLWIRSLDSLTSQPLAGTEGANRPFWSPDSRFIGFFTNEKLKKVDASGGPPQTLSDAPQGLARSAAWNREGVIIFASSTLAPIYRVSSSGGAVSALTKLGPGETSHRAPSFLPDGRHFLFLVQGGEKPGIYVGSLDSNERRLLLLSDSNGTYAAPGYVVFIREQTLMAQRLNLNSFQLEGDAFPVEESVGVINNLGAFGVSDNGVLVYGNSSVTGRQLAWFDRTGKITARIGPLMTYFDLALSADEKRAAVESGPGEIWVVDLVRGVPSRLTFNPAVEDYPVWSPDGAEVLFNSSREAATNVYKKLSSGAGNEEIVLKSTTPNLAWDWSRDGRFILYENTDPMSRSDLWVLPLFGDKKPQLFLQTPFSETMGSFSPDGKWIAYVSDESGKQEVYVQGFPPTGGKWQVSTNGGYTPRWRQDGKELFYMAPDRKIMDVEVKAGGVNFEVSSPKTLFEAPVDNPTGTNRYAVSRDGQRFLMSTSGENTTSVPITVVVNWLHARKK